MAGGEFLVGVNLLSNDTRKLNDQICSASEGISLYFKNILYNN